MKDERLNDLICKEKRKEKDMDFQWILFELDEVILSYLQLVFQQGFMKLFSRNGMLG